MTTVNKALNKVRVATEFGDGATIGLIDPQVGMPVRHGIDNRFIKSIDAGSFQVALSNTGGGSGTIVGKSYPHDLEISKADATGVFYGYGWPSSAGSVAFGHGTIATSAPTNPNGFTVSQGGSPTDYSFLNY